jgi:hypothetical protein
MALGGNVTVNTNKSPTRTAVASLITGCCVGPATGIEDIDNGGGDNSSYATPMPMEGILEEEEQRGDHHHGGFYAAASQQQHQQRNRFTSSPLIERDSSLIKEQSGLLSLLASGTFTETTSPREIATTSNGNGNNNPHSLRRNTTPPTPSMTMMQTPPRSASRRKKHHLQQSSQYSPNNNNNNNNNCPPSPAMELSLARQSANATNQLLMSASSPRISRRHRLGSSDSRSVNSAASTRSHASNSIMGSPKVKKQLAAMTIESPTKKARQENNVHGNHNNNNSNISNSIVMPNLDIDEGYSAENTVAPSPTAAAVTTSTKEPTAATTTMARSTIIPQTSSFSSTEIIDGSQHKQNIVIWKHYTKSQLDTRNDDHLHHLELWTTTPTTSTTTTTTTTTNAAKEDKKKLNEELINTYKFPRVYLQNPKFVEYNHLKTLWWYKLQCGAESTLGHVYDGLNNNNNNNNGNGAEVLFDPSVQPINVWSEPSSTTMKVRGVTYAQDGIKVPSEESMFAVLGVDNFVNEKGSGSGSGDGMKKSGTDSFMERWKNVCKEVGLESVPFL